MLVEFEINRWYKYSNNDKHYFKTSEGGYAENSINTSESIHTGNYRKQTGPWSFTVNTRLLIDLSEIFQYLPNNHPDKIIIYECW